jgi:ribonuclease HI
MYGGQMGINTNNAMELQALEEGLCVVAAKGYDKLIIEGDSQIIINMFKILQHGSPTLKITKSWRLEASLEAIQ